MGKYSNNPVLMDMHSIFPIINFKAQMGNSLMLPFDTSFPLARIWVKFFELSKCIQSLLYRLVSFELIPLFSFK